MVMALAAEVTLATAVTFAAVVGGGTWSAAAVMTSGALVVGLGTTASAGSVDNTKVKRIKNSFMLPS